MPGDDRVDVKKTSGDFVLNKGRDPERRGRFGKQIRATVVFSIGGKGRWVGLFILRGVC